MRRRLAWMAAQSQIRITVDLFVSDCVRVSGNRARKWVRVPIRGRVIVRFKVTIRARVMIWVRVRVRVRVMIWVRVRVKVRG